MSKVSDSLATSYKPCKEKRNKGRKHGDSPDSTVLSPHLTVKVSLYLEI